MLLAIRAVTPLVTRHAHVLLEGGARGVSLASEMPLGAFTDEVAGALLHQF